MAGKPNRYNVFISYRRSGGSAEARLIQAKLREHHLSVFLDVDDLRPGHFNQALLERIGETPNFIVILSAHSLDNCDDERDWLRREIAHALKTERNIIPVLLAGFDFPKSETLPPEISGLSTHQSVTYSHEYFDGTFGKILNYLEPSSEPPAPVKPNRRWKVLSLIALLLLAAGLVAWMNRYRTTTTQPINPANNLQQPTVSPTPDQNIQSAAANSGPVIAKGEVEFETDVDRPLHISENHKQAWITSWFLKPGEFVTSCGPTRIARYTFEFSMHNPDGTSATTTGENDLSIQGPAKMVSSVADGTSVSYGQEVCRLAKVLHGWVKVKVSPADLPKIQVGNRGVFRDQSKNVFAGRVEGINRSEGTVSLKLLDKDVFAESGGKCKPLKLAPKSIGEVTFDVGGNPS